MDQFGEEEKNFFKKLIFAEFMEFFFKSAMDCLCTMHGLSLECLWSVSGVSLDCLCTVSALSLDSKQ